MKLKTMTSLIFSALIAGLTAMVASLLIAAPVAGQSPVDNGVWSGEQTAFQGFAVQYAPVMPPALVFYWFTYDENGAQAWFISDNVPVGSASSETSVDLFRPLGRFLSKDAALGEPVGVLAVSRSGPRILARFGLAPMDGFSDECASEITLEPLPSPLPPPISRVEYPCQSRLFLSRVTPAIPQLE